MSDRETREEDEGKVEKKNKVGKYHFWMETKAKNINIMMQLLLWLLFHVCYVCCVNERKNRVERDRKKKKKGKKEERERKEKERRENRGERVKREIERGRERIVCVSTAQILFF